MRSKEKAYKLTDEHIVAVEPETFEGVKGFRWAVVKGPFITKQWLASSWSKTLKKAKEDALSALVELKLK